VGVHTIIRTRIGFCPGVYDLLCEYDLTCMAERDPRLDGQGNEKGKSSHWQVPWKDKGHS
jgi:hypothetical protein